MSRGLNAATEAVIGSSSLHFVHLLTFNFATPFRLTDNQNDLEYDFGSGAETFLSTGRLVSSSSFEEQLKINNPSISITLTGANLADISLALTEDFNDRQVIIRRAIFDGLGTGSSNIIADPFILFDGRVDSYNIDDDPLSGESAVTWTIASHWADWDKKNGRKCNNQNAQGIIDPSTGSQLYPNEDGFTHTYNQIGDKSWGRVKS